MAGPIIVAPTIVRFTHLMSISQRQANCITDVSLDEFGISRGNAVLELVPPVAKAWVTHVLPTLGANVKFNGTRWLDIDSVDGQGGFHGPVAGDPTQGGLAGLNAPPNCSFLVHKACVHNRRQRNGRYYLPGVMEADSDNSGVLDPAVVTRIATGVANFRAGVNSEGAPLGFTVAMRVVHVTAVNADKVPISWNSTDVDSVSCDGKLATQRRRLRG